jgi:fumarate reductase flavoprotein subunit
MLSSWEEIKINYMIVFLPSDHKGIPRLYATGDNVACNIYGDYHPSFLPGNTLGFAVNSGCIVEKTLEHI